MLTRRTRGCCSGRSAGPPVARSPERRHEPAWARASRRPSKRRAAELTQAPLSDVRRGLGGWHLRRFRAHWHPPLRAITSSSARLGAGESGWRHLMPRRLWLRGGGCPDSDRRPRSSGRSLRLSGRPLAPRLVRHGSDHPDCGASAIQFVVRGSPGVGDRGDRDVAVTASS